MNFDYAMTFPRTLTGVSEDKSSFKSGGDISKSRYEFDEIPGLFNHIPPEVRSSKVCEICSVTFSKFIPSRQKYSCKYCGRVLCSNCCKR